MKIVTILEFEEVNKTTMGHAPLEHSDTVPHRKLNLWGVENKVNEKLVVFTSL